MLKTPKSVSRKWVKRGFLTVVILEGLAFAGTYFIWHKTNTDRGKILNQDVKLDFTLKRFFPDFRQYLNANCPAILEFYYKTGEIIDPQNNSRKLDQASWQQTVNGK